MKVKKWLLGLVTFAAMAVLIAFCLKAVRALPESPASENLS